MPADAAPGQQIHVLATVTAQTAQFATVNLVYPLTVENSGGTWMVAGIDLMPQIGADTPSQSGGHTPQLSGEGRQHDASIVAVQGLFNSGTDLGLTVLGFLGLIALVIGTVSAIGKLREGSGTAITAEIGVIVFSVLILLSVGIAAVLTREANDAGIRNPVPVNSVWGQ